MWKKSIKNLKKWKSTSTETTDPLDLRIILSKMKKRKKN